MKLPNHNRNLIVFNVFLNLYNLSNNTSGHSSPSYSINYPVCCKDRDICRNFHFLFVSALCRLQQRHTLFDKFSNYKRCLYRVGVSEFGFHITKGFTFFFILLSSLFYLSTICMYGQIQVVFSIPSGILFSP